MNRFLKEIDLEKYIRKTIQENIVNSNGGLLNILENKKIADIVICRNDKIPSVFLIECKFYKKKHGRIGFGSRNGRGFQPEILLNKQQFFETNLRWLLAREEVEGFLLLTSDEIRKFVSGGKVSLDKFNNIQAQVFHKCEMLREACLIEKLKNWMLNN